MNDELVSEIIATVMLAKAGIQYAAASASESPMLWKLDPRFRGDDDRGSYAVHSPRPNRQRLRRSRRGRRRLSRRSSPARQLAFPADHGAHPDFRVEWWYFTANLRDADGASYGVQWTLFRQAKKPSDRDEGWASRQLWMGHAAVTSATRIGSPNASRAAASGRPASRPRPSGRGSTIGRCEVARYAGGFCAARGAASAKDFSYALRLDSERGVVLQGEAGYSRKSEQGQASYYYSQPYLRVSGSLVHRRQDRRGHRAGLDRSRMEQPAAGADQTGWDWFSLHLQSGEKLMLFRLRHADGKHFFAGNWIGRRRTVGGAGSERHRHDAGRDHAHRRARRADGVEAVRSLAQAGNHDRAAQPAKLDGCAFQILGRPGEGERQPDGEGYLEMTGY